MLNVFDNFLKNRMITRKSVYKAKLYLPEEHISKFGSPTEKLGGSDLLISLESTY
jgi:hypothetical protein